MKKGVAMKKPKLFVSCFPHLGVLDNWLPIINEINKLSTYKSFTLIIPNALLVRSFNKDNALITIANKIFDPIIVHIYGDIWIEHKSINDGIRWYESNRVILRISDVLQRIVKKRNLFVLNWLHSVYFKKHLKLSIVEFGSTILKSDVLLYDIHAECKRDHVIVDVLQLFNKKYSLPHQLSILNFKEQPDFVKINNINNKIKVFSYAEFQSEFYSLKYGIDRNKIYAVGIPRHDQRWIKKIQEESGSLPYQFDDDNTIILLSLQVSNSGISFDQKFQTIKNIKKILIDELGMRIVIKLHPNEKQEKIYADKNDRLYENILGLNNYGLTWVYSDLHVFALGRGKRLAISLGTGVAFDMVAMGVPCIEYVEFNNSKKNPSEFVDCGLVEGASNLQELCNYIDRLFIDSSQISAHSTNVYKKYFSILNDASMKAAYEIIAEKDTNNI
jgi:hypothetical protein